MVLQTPQARVCSELWPVIRAPEMLIGFAVALLLTWLLLIAVLVIRRPKTLQLEAAYRRFSPTNALPPRREPLPRLRLLILGLFVMLTTVWLGLLLFRASGEPAVESTPIQSATPGGGQSTTEPPASAPRSGSAAGEAIQVKDVAASARPFETVRIRGSYRNGADTFLGVQRWEDGRWLAFPLPTKTDKSGQFTTYVELGQPGRYQLRVFDPDSGVASRTFVLVIKG
jgi:hypothetical protein